MDQFLKGKTNRALIFKGFTEKGDLFSQYNMCVSCESEVFASSTFQQKALDCDKGLRRNKGHYRNE